MTKRCPRCDRDGEVADDKTGGFKPCPRCGGTKQIESEPMSEEKLFQLMMISCACLAALCGLGAVALVVACAMSFAIGVLVCALLLAGAAVGSAYYAVFFSSKAQAPRVFNNQDEKEVLNRKQHKILKDARAEVVMERALIEIRHEQENIVHNQLEAANDPDRPPHQTRWTEGVRNAISGKRPGDL